MNTRIHLFIKTLKKKPKLVFLIDGLGALLTTFFLAVILAAFQEHIGIPKTTLYFLSIIAFVFTVYSISCYFANPANWQPFLKVIAFANLMYCFLTIGFIYYHFQNLTVMGLLYFILEILIISTLATLEFIVTTLKKSKKTVN